MISQKIIKNSDDLIRSINELPNNFIYRGHANSAWKLESTLERTIGSKWSSELAKKFEDHYLNLFKSKYHIYNSNEHAPKSKLAWLSLMQHYGAPTRLIDFTESPYVALYFALEAYNPLLKNDLAIYAIDYNSIMDESLAYISRRDSSFKKNRHEIIGKQDELFDDVVDRFSYEVVWITEPLELNARIDRQSGTFLISGDKEKRIEELLANVMYNDVKVIKFIIPSNIYENIYALLRKMNINAKTIYGDLGGLAKSIKMDMQVHAI
ncbi:MAG: FRG domain-containing protein [Aeromonadaceae bacterium]